MMVGRLIFFSAMKNKVMLLGHSDSYVRDKAMQVTIAFNHFGKGLMQRMPRYCTELYTDVSILCSV